MATKNRTDLKSYFVKNAIPTEGNFADLIDSQLNQAQDGVFKPDGDALTVVAAPGAQKRVLRLFANYPATNPDWMISLNPAQDPANAASSKPGFGITDGTGKTRLFIDAATGQIGVGTNTPSDILHVRNADTVGLLESSTTQAALRLATSEGTGNYVGFANRSGGNAAISVGTAGDVLIVKKDGSVVVSKASGGTGSLTVDGTATFSGPIAGSLTIRRDVTGGLGPRLTLFNGGDQMASCAIDFNNRDPGTGDPGLRVQSIGDGSYSSHLMFLTKVPGDPANKLVERLRLTSNGLLQFSNDSPKDKIVFYEDGPSSRFGIGLNAANINLFYSTNSRFSLRQNSSSGTEVFTVSGTGEVTAAKSLTTPGALFGGIGIGTGDWGFGTGATYETLQLKSIYNLRVFFGTTQRAVLENSGQFTIYFDKGYWRFQTDGNLVKYRNDGTGIWALNNVSGTVGW